MKKSDVPEFVVVAPTIIRNESPLELIIEAMYYFNTNSVMFNSIKTNNYIWHGNLSTIEKEIINAEIAETAIQQLYERM